MAFKKGHRKYAGRKQATPNKITAELRQYITTFLSKKWKSIEKDFDKLDPKDRLFFYEKLLQFALPRLENIGLHEIGFEHLTNEQLDELIIKLKERYEKEE